jgi:hypothetical protein
MEEYVRISTPPQYGLRFESEDFRHQIKEQIDGFKPDVFLIDPWNAVASRTTQEDYLEAFRNVQSVMPAGNDRPSIGIVAHHPQSEAGRTTLRQSTLEPPGWIIHRWICPEGCMDLAVSQ